MTDRTPVSEAKLCPKLPIDSFRIRQTHTTVIEGIFVSILSKDTSITYEVDSIRLISLKSINHTVPPK